MQAYRRPVPPLRAIAFAPFSSALSAALASRTSPTSALLLHRCQHQRRPPRCPFAAGPAQSSTSRASPFLGPRLPSSISSASSSLSSISPRSARVPSTMAAAAGRQAVRVLVAVADGSEEIETATVADVLVRAGAAVTLAAAGEARAVRMSRGLVLQADALLSEACGDTRGYDLVVLPGGMPGAANLRDCAPLVELLRAAVADPDGPVIGAICAAPAVVLAHHGLLGTQDATCYPAPKFVQMLDHVTDGDVVVSADRRIVTSRGPATAMAFALALVERLYDKTLADKLSAELLVTL
jgi:protein deglycase